VKKFIALWAALLVVGASAAGLASASGRSTSIGLDVYYLENSIRGDQFEILGGQYMVKKAQSAKVRALAARLVKDHTSSMRDAIAVAHKMNIHFLVSPTASQQWELQQVYYAPNSNKDTVYTNLEVADHRDDIADTQDEIQMGASPLVRNLAKQDLPMLQMHLALAKAARP
jgi:predicted outer membrane protein